MKKLKIEIPELDYIDAKILAMLVANARTPIAEIARELNMSSPSANERIKKLEDIGIIQNYTITVNPGIVGYDLAVWIRIHPLPGKLSKVVEVLKSIPEIVECDRMTGDDCFMAKAYIKKITDLEQLIDTLLPYAKTNTSVIQASPFAKRLPPLFQNGK